MHCDIQKDFDYRDTLPESTIPEEDWYNGTHHFVLWGPPAATYPPAIICENLKNEAEIADWERQRIVLAAKKYLGLPYKHHRNFSLN